MKYDELIDYMLKTESIYYSDFVFANLEKDPNFDSDDDKLMESIRVARAKGANIQQKNQDESKADFCHIAVNQKFPGENDIKARLYLSPQRANVHKLVIELVNRSLAEGKTIYLKYARSDDRIDQMVFYLSDKKDIDEKLELLKKIRLEHPELFRGMNKSKAWVNETDLPNVFLAPEPKCHDRLGRRSSYGEMMRIAIESTKTILEYGYGIKENEDLASKRNDPNFYENFQEIFTEMLKRCGICMQKDKRTGQYENLFRPMDLNDLRILFVFNYDKKTQTLTETRGGFGLGEKKQDYTFSPKDKDAFFKYFIPEEEKKFDDSGYPYL